MKQQNKNKRKIFRRCTAAVLSVVVLGGAVAFPPKNADISLVTEIEADAAGFTPRKTAPTKADSWYYEGNPYNGEYGLPNCTCYAYGRAWEILGEKPNLPTTGNAGSWFTKNKSSGSYNYGSTPKLGAIACWDQYDSNHGHVAVVEEIDGNDVLLSESHYGKNHDGVLFDNKKMKADGSDYLKSYRFLGYIYVGDFSLNNEPEGHLDVATGSDGCVYLSGWSLDRDEPDASMQIHVYMDGPAGSGTLLANDIIIANVPRSDVNNATGVGGDHGFSASVSAPEGTHTFYVYGVNPNDGTSTLLENSPFTTTITSVRKLPDGSVDLCNLGDDFIATIQSAVAPKYYVSTSVNGNVHLYAAEGGNYSSKRLWHFKRNSDGTYKIWSFLNSKCLDVSGGQDVNCSNIQTASSNTSTGQKWSIVQYGSTYYLKSALSPDRVLDITGASFANATNIQLHDVNVSDAQKLSINVIKDTSAPTIQKVDIINKSLSGYTVKVTVNDTVGVKKVIVPVWKNTDQSDLIGGREHWRDYNFATQVGMNTWTYDVKLSDHDNKYGVYYTDVYAIDYFGNEDSWHGENGKRTNVEVGVYTATFNANGGTIATSSGAKTSTTKKVIYKEKLGTLPKPTRTGYTFLGWYWGDDESTKITETTVKQFTGNKTFYAHWKANTYTLTFKANGGTIKTASGTAVTSTTKNVTFMEKVGKLPVPTRTGYTFLGWYWGDDESTKITEDTVKKFTGNKTFYAHWKANTYTLTFKANGGTIKTASGTTVTSTTKNVTFMEKLGKLPVPTRTGYTFLGWYWGDDESTKVTETTVKQFTGNKTFYAHWKANTYTLTFKANGGTIKTASGTTVTSTTKNVTFMEKLGKLPVPTRTGYTFLGWYWGDDESTKITETTVKQFTGNKTFYAHWKAK